MENQKPRKQKQGKAQKESPKEPEESPDFKYIVRIANTDIDGKKKVAHALASIDGVGIRTAQIIAGRVDVDVNKRIGDLDNNDIETLGKAIESHVENVPDWLNNRQADYKSGKTQHVYSTEIMMNLRDDVNLLRKIRCYRGIRHENYQKVRGQRTRSNGRQGVAVGVSRQKGGKK